MAAIRPSASTTIVVGGEFGGTSRKPSATRPAGSNRLGYVDLAVTNAFALSRSSRMFTPRKTAFVLVASWAASSSGASVLQGAHHDAQKLTTRPLPRYV